MSLRRLIVEIDPSKLNVTAFCNEHGFSTWFFYDLRKRFARDGDVALEPRSRAPHRVANRTSDEVEDAIVDWRKRLTELGLDAGAASIADRLALEGMAKVPSDSTIWRILDRRGFITPDPSKAPRPASRRFAAKRINERWQHDDTPWQLADDTQVKVFNVLDDCSRRVLASRAVPVITAARVFDTLTVTAIEHGWPETTLSDNASVHRALDDSLAALGIRAIHPRPYHPQTCGKVERFHQTLKRHLAACDPAHTLDDLQAQLDWFTDHYNHHRPHRAIGRRTPAAAWDATPKSGPANRPLDTPTHIHHTNVSRNGVVQLGRRHGVIIGRAYAGQDATAIVTGTNCHVFIEGRLIRALTLDPTRYTQPLTTVRDAPRHP